MVGNGRYSRQVLVIGANNQQKLSESKVAILGLGALGSAAAELLSRSGIGHLTLIDRDIVELSNLQRQFLYSEADIGAPKAEAATKRLKDINSTINYDSIITDINHKNIEKVLSSHDLILDCTDNLYTRFLLNDFTKKKRVPWIYSAAIREHGSVMVVTPKTPCFRCTIGEAAGLDTCDTAGVSNTIIVAIASIQANEAIRYLTNNGNANTEKSNIQKSITNDNQNNGQSLIHIDLSTLSLSKLKTKQNLNCPACKGNYEYLCGKKEMRSLSYQCSDTYQFFMENINLPALERKWKPLGTIKKGKGFLFFKSLSVFDNGRILIKAKSMGEAKSLLARYVGV
ncbi:MAG TPA: HesA/MoeB/ThiF family protein [Candidatus Nanoarchaeia archaeon]|nr:HesA/MoeB/ThiF family protein [Candidatus Nanoarchaeia archaeon]